uniref:Pectinesterase inhibitor domain-containing protein n=1 Tax=Nelumbo nucifera TaxID=4432 RepID=A0A822Z4B9_NELNU|nr:TPA_asm: hypothetical protein HUJ06_008910 [Nelumbo nucifera]
MHLSYCLYLHSGPQHLTELLFHHLCVLPIPKFTSRISSPPSRKTAAASTIDPAIKKICDGTDYPELCLSSIKPYLTGRGILCPSPKWRSKPATASLDLLLTMCASLQSHKMS